MYLHRALESLTNIRFDFISSLYQIEKKGLKTCKTICINKKLVEGLKRVSYNQLIREAIKLKKKEAA